MAEQQTPRPTARQREVLAALPIDVDLWPSSGPTRIEVIECVMRHWAFLRVENTQAAYFVTAHGADALDRPSSEETT